MPHEVTRVFGGTGPSWFEENKVPNGARCVVVFREREENFYKRLRQGKGWSSSKTAGKEKAAPAVEKK